MAQLLDEGTRTLDIDIDQSVQIEGFQQNVELDHDALDVAVDYEQFMQMEGLEEEKNIEALKDVKAISDDVKSDETKLNIKLTDINRFVVLGACGVGKSTLCNVLSGSNDFEISDGFDCGTQHIKAKRFVYEMDKKAVPFEAIDCPGLFGEENISNAEEREKEFAKRIHQCMDLTKDGISAFLLLLPLSALQHSAKVSLEFMKEYFLPNAKPYVWLVITKSRNLSTKTIMQRMTAKNDGKIILEFIQYVQDRVVAIESVDCNAEKLKQYRHNILKLISDTNTSNGGPYTSQGFWRLFKKQLSQPPQSDPEQNFNFWTKAASVFAAGASAGEAVIKYWSK